MVHEKKESVKTLLELGASVNLKDCKFNKTALMYAVEGKLYQEPNLEIINLLIKYGADVNKNSSYIQKRTLDNGDTLETKITFNPLEIASEGNSVEVVKILVENGADPNNYSCGPQKSPICRSLILEQLNISKYLIVDLKSELPDYCLVNQQNDTLSVYKFLLRNKFYPSEKNELKFEILNYLENKM